MKKRIILIAIIGLFLLTLPLIANAEIIDSGSCGNDVTWTLNNDGLLTISGKGYMTNSPWKIRHKSKIKKVIIEDGVKNIWDKSFLQMSQLESVTISKSVTIIGEYAFSECGLKTISIPSSVNKIEDGAFYSCSSLSTVKFSKGLESVGEYAFSGCPLKEIYLPEGLKTINDYAFNSCSFNAEVRIPKSVESIADNAFFVKPYYQFGQFYQYYVELDSYASKFLSLHNQTFKTDKSPFTYIYLNDGTLKITQCDKDISSCDISESVTVIGENAFLDCFDLKKITIQGIISSIGKDAFNHCFELSNITLLECNDYAIKWFSDNGFKKALNILPHILTKTEEVMASFTESGFEAYWTCDICKKLFSDAEGINQIEKPIEIPMLIPEDGWNYYNYTYYYWNGNSFEKGWKLINEKWYYFNPESAAMVIGWVSDSGTWYYFDASGAMVTGWLQDGATWYYFDASGAMATGTKVINGTEYTFDASGAWVDNTVPVQTGWLQDGGQWYYYDESGTKVTGWKSISGTWYYFKSSGAMQPEFPDHITMNPPTARPPAMA